MAIIPSGTRKQFKGREYELRDHRWRRISDDQDLKSGYKPLNIEREQGLIDKAMAEGSEERLMHLQRRYEAIAEHAESLDLQQDWENHDGLYNYATDRLETLQAAREDADDEGDYELVDPVPSRQLSKEDRDPYWIKYGKQFEISRNTKGHLVIYQKPETYTKKDGSTVELSDRTRTIGTSQATGETLIAETAQTRTFRDAAGKVIDFEPSYRAKDLRPAHPDLIRHLQLKGDPQTGWQIRGVLELSDRGAALVFAAQPEDDQLPFAEALEYLEQKTNLDTDTWRDGQGIVQLANFTVAAAKGALLQDIRDTLDRSISAGESMQDFMDRFAKVTDRWVGRSAWRAQLICDQNIRQAWGVGRLQQQRETMADRPYWQWRHGGSREPRPEHLALDGKIFRAEDVTAYPPIGFQCTCQVFSLSQRDFERNGGKLSVFDLEPDEGFVGREEIDKKIDQMKVDRVLKRFMRSSMGN